MSIEVKQLIVKSTLVDDSRDDERSEPTVDIERLKRQVIDECRRLIEQSLESRQER
jgi:hypothetical protein